MPRVFQTDHRAFTALRYHHHGVSFATIVLEGGYTEVRDGVPNNCAAGEIVLHRASEEHADYFTSAARCLNVELEPAAVHGAFESGLPTGAVRSAVDAVVRAFSTDAGGAALEAAVLRLQSALASRPPARHSVPDWLRAAIDRFEWSGDPPLREAARIVGVHQTHFSREFHRHVGLTPNGFRRRARVRRASELLLETALPLASVAQACGFNDQSHLTRTFGAALGLPPAAYRRVFAR
jgi:AraC-like DNA-binding protein